MSLINRMLGDLAARQAPGAESLDGVHLADPLAPPERLSARNVMFALTIALSVASVVMWWRWPRPLPVPVPRGVLLEPSLVPALPGRAAPPAASTAPVAAADATLPAHWSLRLDTTYTPPAAMPARAGERPSPRAAVAASPRAPLSSALDARAPAASRKGPPAELKLDQTVGTGAGQPAAAASSAAADDAALRKRQARDWLSKDQPLAALEALGQPTNAWDRERSALRAAALQRAGRQSEAAAVYRNLAEAPGGEAGNYVGLAISLEALQRTAEARDAYRRALEEPSLSAALRAYAESRMAALDARP